MMVFCDWLPSLAMYLKSILVVANIHLCRLSIPIYVYACSIPGIRKPCKEPGDKYFKHEGHLISVTTTQLCCFRMGLTVDTKQTSELVQIFMKLFTEAISRSDLPFGSSLVDL